MFRAKSNRPNRRKTTRFLAVFLTVVMLVCCASPLFHNLMLRVSAEVSGGTSGNPDSSLETMATDGDASTLSDETSATVKKLQNGSFEDGQTWTGPYKQVNQSTVPYWNTTATDSKIELYMNNTGTYLKNDAGTAVQLTPTVGSYGAELNADEESTLYQNVSTMPSTIYEWGLDHGARNGTDTMALVIGPKQDIAPSKPAKNGRDQFMQMADWLIEQGLTSFKSSAGLGEKLVVYSKKFAARGTFEDNAGNNAFSLTPSNIYTERWDIWIMSSCKATTETVNPWNSYGSNAEGSAGSSGGSTGVDIDLSKYYLYTVPAGQTETIFGFVSVGFENPTAPPGKEKTYGNFLDNINFQLYHPLSGSSTAHGSGVVGGSDGSSGGTGGSEGHKVTVDNNLVTYVIDGEPLKIQAVVKNSDAIADCEFVGVYYTKQDENGDPYSVFVQLAGHEIEDTGDLTEEQKKDKWLKTINENGDVVYTYYLDDITTATDLHFVFIKSPTVTYDPNGGKPYIAEKIYNTNELENVYSFKPVLDPDNAQAETGTIFIAPYVSHAAEGQNDGWKFMGWLLTGDTVEISEGETVNTVNADQLGSLMLDGEHTIACDYTIDNASVENAAQYFKIYGGNVTLNEQKSYNDETHNVTGVTWNDNGEEILYANMHKGITLVAQWRWLQAFIPQVGIGENQYMDSESGGTVEITSVTDKTDENYNGAYNENGAKSYHAATDEIITATATAKEGFTFEGWYDTDGNLVTTHRTFTYTETKESVNTYYARFSGNITQTYIRQLVDGDTIVEITDDNIATLSRYTYTDVVGKVVSSTAIPGTGYWFVGWYDSEGNKVPDDMILSDGNTLSYTTTTNATYYARFERMYSLNVAKIDGDQSTADTKVPLVGAEFTVYLPDNSGTKTIVYDGKRIKCTAVSSKVTALTSDSSKAVAAFGEKLMSGTDYYLVETKAPSGYRLLDKPLKINIDPSGTTATIDGISKDISDKVINIELANYLTVHMPSSGASTTGSWYLAVGLAVLLAAALFLLAVSFNRSKRKSR